MRGRRRLPLSRRHVRIGVGAAWLVAAFLSARPEAFTARWWRFDAGQSAMGQPDAIRHSILWAVGLAAGHAAIVTTALVGLQLAIGLALVLGRAERLAVIASVPLVLGIWWIGEGFGALPTGFATLFGGAPGAVVLYPVLSVLGWPTEDQSTPARLVHRQAGRMLWGLLWCGQAALLLPWRFPPGQVLQATVEESNGGPTWVTSLNTEIGSYFSTHGILIAIVLSVLSVLIGSLVVVGRAPRLSLVAGCTCMGASWVVFQGAGLIVSGASTDLNLAPLVILLGLALWPHHDETLAPQLTEKAWRRAPTFRQSPESSRTSQTPGPLTRPRSFRHAVCGRLWSGNGPSENTRRRVTSAVRPPSDVGPRRTGSQGGTSHAGGLREPTPLARNTRGPPELRPCRKGSLLARYEPRLQRQWGRSRAGRSRQQTAPMQRSGSFFRSSATSANGRNRQRVPRTSPRVGARTSSVFPEQRALPEVPKWVGRRSPLPRLCNHEDEDAPPASVGGASLIWPPGK